MIKQAFMTQDENGNWVKKKTKKEIKENWKMD